MAFTKRTHTKETIEKIKEKCKGQRNSQETEFKKGIVPWNKGLKGSIKVNSGSFKKGCKINLGRKRYDMIRENHFNWKGGITSLKQKIYHCQNYILWRSKVFQRDNWTCQTCQKRSKIGEKVFLEAHHKKESYKIIYENNIKTIEEALNCKELWDIDNGVTLCEDCHNLTKPGRVKNVH